MEKLKRIYAEAVQNSGMPLYSFVQKVKAENGLARDEDIFLHWDAIREKYEIGRAHV